VRSQALSPHGPHKNDTGVRRSRRSRRRPTRILGALALLTQVGLEALLSAIGLVLFAVAWYFWRVRREGGRSPST